MPPVIELRGVSKRYGATCALDRVDLAVEGGQFITLLGPSGCGKTTLLRILAGFVEPTEGEVLLDGRVITGVAANRRPIGLLFQHYALFPHMTVEQNVSFGLRMRRQRGETITRKVDELLDLVEMRRLARSYPGTLSGGQQQRVALARTLAIEPRVLLLDEPLAALDRKLRLQMQIDLKKLIDRIGITTICVTHDQHEALTMSDRIALMNHGAIEQYGSPMDVYDRPRSAFVAGFVGNANLLRGTVRGDGAGGVIFESASLKLELPFGETMSEGRAMLLLRPEQLRISEGPSQSDDLAGRVTFVSHLGSITEYEVKLDAGPDVRVETVRSSESPALTEGSKAYIGRREGAGYWILSDEPVSHEVSLPGEGRQATTAKAQTSRLFLLVLFALAALLGSASCGSSRSSSEVELVAISYAGETQVPHRRFLADPFEAAHPSVKVTLVPSESEDVVAQIKAASGSSPYDVIPLGEPRQITGIKEGWIEQTPVESLPNLKDVHPQFVEACKGHGVPETYSLMGLAYNPALVPRPDSWQALWAPDYRGKIGLTTPASNLGFAFVVLTAMLFGGSASSVDPAWAQLAKLEPFVVASNPTALAQLFERREIAVAPLWNNDAAVLASKGLNVRFAKPDPGAVVLVSCLSVIKNTAHPDLARDYINQVISAEYQRQAVQRPWFFGPTNRHVAIPGDAAEYLPAVEQLPTLMRIDWDTATAVRASVTDRFNRDFSR